MFAVTGWLVTLLADARPSQVAGLFKQGGIVDTLSATVWDSTAWMTEGTILGRVLHTPIG